jgi:peptidoglycan/xylan/chitin deacetylase (PgdA/CDA1 family)
MILTYHHVKLFANDEITVSVFHFVRQMFFIRNKTVVYLDDYDPDNKNHVVITFDDGYKDVLTYALPILCFFNYPFEVFIVADFYDQAEKGNKSWLNKKDLQRLIACKGRLQYHTKSHPYLDRIDDLQQLETEIIVPENIKSLDDRGFQWLAYPYWRWNERVVDVTKKYYKGARSGNGFEKDGRQFALGSIRMNNTTTLKDT